MGSALACLDLVSNFGRNADTFSFKIILKSILKSSAGGCVSEASTAHALVFKRSVSERFALCEMSLSGNLANDNFSILGEKTRY